MYISRRQPSAHAHTRAHARSRPFCILYTRRGEEQQHMHPKQYAQAQSRTMNKYNHSNTSNIDGNHTYKLSSRA